MSIFKYDAYSAESYDKDEMLFIARCMESRIKDLESYIKRLEKEVDETRDCLSGELRSAEFANTIADLVALDDEVVAKKILDKFYEVYEDKNHWTHETSEPIAMVKGVLGLIPDAMGRDEFYKLVALKQSFEKE